METLSSITFDVKTHDGYALSDFSVQIRTTKWDGADQRSRRRRFNCVTHNDSPLPALDCPAPLQEWMWCNKSLENKAAADEAVPRAGLSLFLCFFVSFVFVQPSH